MAVILLIDDNLALRTTIRKILVGLGHEVIEAGDGEVGLRLAAERTFDLIVTDIMMPRTDGIEAIRAFHRSNRSAKIIAMSGHKPDSDVDYLRFARTFGADAVLRMPFRSSTLLTEVERLLGSN